MEERLKGRKKITDKQEVRRGHEASEKELGSLSTGEQTGLVWLPTISTGNLVPV